MHRFLFVAFTFIVLFLSQRGNAQGKMPSKVEEIVVTDTTTNFHDVSLVRQKDGLGVVENPTHYLIFSKCDSVIESRENFMQSEILYQNDTLLLIHHWLAQSDFLETIHLYKLILLEEDCKIQSHQYSNRDNETFKVFPCHLKVKGDCLEVYSGRRTWVETIPVNQVVADKLRVIYPVIIK